MNDYGPKWLHYGITWRMKKEEMNQPDLTSPVEFTKLAVESNP